MNLKSYIHDFDLIPISCACALHIYIYIYIYILYILYIIYIIYDVLYSIAVSLTLHSTMYHLGEGTDHDRARVLWRAYTYRKTELM